MLLTTLYQKLFTIILTTFTFNKIEFGIILHKNNVDVNTLELRE